MSGTTQLNKVAKDEHVTQQEIALQVIPGEFPFPMISRDSSDVRFVICTGRDAGMAGEVSCLQPSRRIVVGHGLKK